MAQIKHHWWWKANFVFKEVKMLKDYTGLVLFVEEDHYLAPDFIHCLSLMGKTCRYYCPNCWFFSLGVRNRVNFGLYSDWVTHRGFKFPKITKSFRLVFKTLLRIRVWLLIELFGTRFPNIGKISASSMTIIGTGR